MYELSRITLHLRPRKFNRIPAWQGRAAQALFYHTLRDINETASETIHDSQKWFPHLPKPFTMSSIIGATQRENMIALKPSQTIQLQLTTLHPHLTAIVQHGVLPMWLRDGVSLHDQDMTVLNITQHTRLYYKTLLREARADEQIILYFTAPTAFRCTDKTYHAKPDTVLTFTSLFRRWNAFAPCVLPDALLDTIEHRLIREHVSVRRRTLKFARGKKGIMPGFYGEVRWRLREPSVELRRMINALADFATFSGIGIKTTIGMGQVHRIENTSLKHPFKYPHKQMDFR